MHPSNWWRFHFILATQKTARSYWCPQTRRSYIPWIYDYMTVMFWNLRCHASQTLAYSSLHECWAKKNRALESVLPCFANAGMLYMLCILFMHWSIIFVKSRSEPCRCILKSLMHLHAFSLSRSHAQINASVPSCLYVSLFLHKKNDTQEERRRDGRREGGWLRGRHTSTVQQRCFLTGIFWTQHHQDSVSAQPSNNFRPAF